MSILSVTAVSFLVERHVRQHQRIGVAVLVHILDALDISEPRVRAGVALALDRGRIQLGDDDGRPVLAAGAGHFFEATAHTHPPTSTGGTVSSKHPQRFEATDER